MSCTVVLVAGVTANVLGIVMAVVGWRWSRRGSGLMRVARRHAEEAERDYARAAAERKAMDARRR